MSSLKLAFISGAAVLALSIGAVAHTTHQNRILACTSSYGTASLDGSMIDTVDVTCPHLGEAPTADR